MPDPQNGPAHPDKTSDYAGHMTNGFHETHRDARTERGSRETYKVRSDGNKGSGQLAPTGPQDPNGTADPSYTAAA
jgi:hypothetical protein